MKKSTLLILSIVLVLIILSGFFLYPLAHSYIAAKTTSIRIDDLALTKASCENSCEKLESGTATAQERRAYCEGVFKIEEEGILKKAKCGEQSSIEITLNRDEELRGFETGDLGVDCQITC